MKNILLLLMTLAFSIVSLGQIKTNIIDNTKFKVYSNDTIYSSHNSMGNAIESFMNIKFKNKDANAIIVSEGTINVALSGTPICPDPVPCPDCPPVVVCPDPVPCPDGTITTKDMDLAGWMIRAWYEGPSTDPNSQKHLAVLTQEGKLYNVLTDSIIYPVAMHTDYYFKVRNTYLGETLIKTERLSPQPRQVTSWWYKWEEATDSTVKVYLTTNGKVRISYFWGKSYNKDNPEFKLLTNNYYYGAGQVSSFNKVITGLQPDTAYSVWVKVEFQDGTIRYTEPLSIWTKPTPVTP